ncbi:DUF3291 domain-containing protein [Phenylobacterium montanum]|uniref:DUF3291 domain-containing protein n=1 Tax=Phenylobacterium montanum TaxID=2823693 RepID=A0A975FZX3_9CAUL|nr:DUF3291 domain-containing protein [Caulobacter sp. S6]QUD88573.1 DUF3291 domain-containing protein [Caulobacter sp. S6]
MTAYHLAQINIGTLKAPMDAPETAGFAENLERINALADNQPGFVWRLVGEADNATDLKFFDDPMTLLNMSVWTDLESLAAFVYRTDHRDVMRRRAEWFHRMELYMVLWWVPAGHVPTPQEAIARLETLRRLGPSPEAFTFKTPFPPPGEGKAVEPVLDECA